MECVWKVKAPEVVFGTRFVEVYSWYIHGMFMVFLISELIMWPCNPKTFEFWLWLAIGNKNL